MVHDEVPDQQTRDGADLDAQDEEIDEFAEADVEVEPDKFDEADEDEIDDLEGGLETLDEEDVDIDVTELTSKEQSARTLEIRRALEERNEAKRLSEELD